MLDKKEGGVNKEKRERGKNVLVLIIVALLKCFLSLLLVSFFSFVASHLTWCNLGCVNMPLNAALNFHLKKKENG